MNGRFGVRTLLTMLESDFAEHHVRIGRDRLFALLGEHNLLIRPRRRYVRTTNSSHHYRKWPNLIKDIEINRPEQVWVSDITYIKTQNGFLYLSLVTDAYSRKLMGYNLSHRLKAKGAIAALNMAISQRQHPDQPLIHHSDRGIQYCCNSYVEALQGEDIQISMAAKGNPYENPMAERINRTLKEQLGMDANFQNYPIALNKLINVVKIYNHKRPHSSCERLTPQQAHQRSGPMKKSWKDYRKLPVKVGGADALQTSSQV